MSIEARTVAWTALVFKWVMTLADALWFITYWWHETVTTLHSHSPALKPYAYKALSEAWVIWAMAGKLHGRKEVKEQWDKPHCDEVWGVHVHTTVAWDGYQCFSQKNQACQEGRKEGWSMLCLCGYINNSDICSIYGTKHHTCVKYRAWGSGLDGIHTIIMLIVTTCNYWGKSLFI